MKTVNEGELFNKIRICAQCGICSSVCPLTYVSNFNPRIFVRKLQLGLIKSGSSSGNMLWICLRCKACSELCPEDINFPEVILNLRKNIANKIT